MLQIAELEGFLPQVMRLHSLIEQYAVAKGNPENIAATIKRTADQLKLKMMMSGHDGMSQIAGAILMQTARAGNQAAKARGLREQMGNLRFQLDLAIRTIQREDEAKQRLIHDKKEAAKAAERAVAREQERHAAETSETSGRETDG